MNATLMAFQVALAQGRTRHGTAAEWTRGCRCPTCRIGHTVLNREYRKRDPRRLDAAWRKAQKGAA